MSSLGATFFDNHNIPESKLQELNDIFLSSKKERLKYIKSNLFLDCILESITHSYGITEMLAVKIRDIILRAELVQSFITKGDKHDNISLLLDIKEFNDIQLTFQEEKDLKIAVEQRITEKRHTLIKELSHLSDSDDQYSEEIIDKIKFNVQSEQDNLIFWQAELKNARRLYANTMILYGQKLHQLFQLKLESVPIILDDKSNEISLNWEKFNLRLNLLEQSLKVSIFGDIIPTDAYKTALRDLKLQQEQCYKDIDNLSLNKEKYEDILKIYEFHDILNDFKQYKKGIDKKKWIYNKLLNKID